MNNGELLVSPKILIYIFLFLLYVPIVLTSYWKLIPRLSLTAKRIASAFLAAQILVIAIAVEIRSDWPYEIWLWNVNMEWNIPSTLASIQLALVGGVALIKARLAKAQPAWHRLYLAGIGLVFLFFAWDEYFTVREGIQNWERYYAVGGVLMAAVTAAVAARLPRRTWIWHLCLLTGLAISAAGAIGIDSIPSGQDTGIYLRNPICGSLGFLRLDECLHLSWFEETLEFLGIWVTLLAILGQFSDTAPRRIWRILYTLPALWIFLLFLHSLVPRLELQHLAQPAAVQFETGVHLHGYHIDSGEEAAHIRLYVSVRPFDLRTGYSIYLVDHASGESVTSLNIHPRRPVTSQHSFWLLGPGYMPIYRQQMEVKIPPQTPTNRALWVVLTLWREKGGEYVSQKVLASDHQLLDDTQVVLGELALPASDADGRP